MLRPTIIRNTFLKKSYSTINTGTSTVVKSHKFRNRFLTISLSLVAIYGTGIILSETDNRYSSVYNDNIPFANNVLESYDDIKNGNIKLSDLSWETIKNKYSSYITGGTLGIPLYRPKKNELNNAHLLNLSKLDQSKLKDLNPEFNSILNQIRYTVDALNDQQIPLTNSQTTVITKLFDQLYETVYKFNENLNENIKKNIVNGSKDRIDQFEKKYLQETDEKKKELDRKYDEKFESFKTVLEENVTKLLETSLESNLETLQAKQANEISLLSITQVQEFNKIIEEKVEQERNGKLANLNALDERIAKLSTTMSKFGDILSKNQVITRLSLMVNDIKGRLDSNNSYSIELDGDFSKMKIISKALPKAGCGCSSGKCKCKKCTGSCSTKSTIGGQKLLNVTIEELDALSKDGPILSNEQLFNRWNLLESDFKTASLLPPNAGILGHITAKFFSFFLFSKKGISTSGDDLDALFARVQTNLETAKLDDAIEDVISLKGWPRVLCEQWVKDARRKLEIESLIDILDCELKVM
ncbi:similar to Saccharomyces cerevisiae YKR016W FCJ1 Mitochondrial inner membrane protein involved in formation and molecular structure of crista junctions [Maudiozyma saulgeensis]|uniref:MICOS complex subunit MIC60 n=1 Tax=Maudiozyma saulgeensis TaxID=1789683 RepID=A0A1X7R217_9SACH|nr:similar to Saccharomyces cerevisiae YKR016W FCJ1 Mitochondrial inner membrane protein involved in formation and molecular structure of crista junctions [Kazachstania saulgeensis]